MARRKLWVLLGLALASSCSLEPEYTRPSAELSPAWRELKPADYASTDGWKSAQPQDGVIRGDWWKMLGDPQLDALEDQVDISNQSVAQAAANFRAARALVAEARSQQFPTVTTTPTVTRSSSSAAVSHAPPYLLPFDASYEVDLWGRVRNSVSASAREAQASAADLENVRLSIQAELAVDYLQLRAQDSQKKLLDDTVADFRKALDLTRVRHEGGIASDLDVAQAETQLDTTLAQDTDLGVQRAQLEHAIAVLIGKPASAFSIPIEPLGVSPPAVPLGVPSHLLERRPDVAAAERRVAEANAQIGVARAAYFPTFTLTGEAGFASTTIGSLLTWPLRVWSVGASLAQTLFDAGKRSATVRQARASYDGTVATYRQTVLTATQQVEDALAAIRILSQERGQQDDAVRSAETALARAEDRYRFGVDSYLNVITAQNTLLTNQRTAVTIRLQQVTATVQLVKALGGGWEASRLPSQHAVAGNSPAPAAKR